MACILSTGLLGIMSICEADTHFVLKGYEVWHNRHYERRFQPTEDSRAALAVEDTVYQRLGSHPHILEYNGQVLVAKGIYSLKLEWAEGDL